jgi:hypothetical protein
LNYIKIFGKLTIICWFTDKRATGLLDIFLENKILRKRAIMLVLGKKIHLDSTATSALSSFNSEI